MEEDEAIIERPKNVSAELGSMAYMSCKSHGNLRDYTSWVKLGEGDNFEMLKEGSEVLKINNVTLESEGFYACVVGNSVASVLSYAYLTVRNTKYIPNHQIDVKHIGLISVMVLLLLLGIIRIFMPLFFGLCTM